MENYWQSKSVNIGAVRQYSKKTITFQALPNIPKIVNIIPGCQCTQPMYDEKTRTLSVVYSSGSIPPQVQGNQSINKTIVIIYEDNTRDVLHISGVKIR